MNREFLVNVLLLVAVNLLVKPFYIFGIDRTVQNVVGVEEYGVYFTLFNFTFLFYIISDFGIQNFNNRNIAQHRQLLGKYFPNILVLKGLLVGLYGWAVLLVGWAVGYVSLHGHLLFMVALNQALVSLVFFLRSNVSGLGLYRVDSFLSALDRVLMIVICSVLLWGGPWREAFCIEWFVYAQTASLCMTGLVVFGVVRGRIPRLRFSWNPTFLWLILRESYPYALVIFLMTLYARIDVVMVERMLVNGEYEAGVYASAYRLLDAANMVGFLFAGLLLPMFSRMLKVGEPVEELLSFSFQLIWAGAVVLAMSVFFFRQDIMLLLYTEATLYWGEVLGVLIWSFMAYCGIYIYGTLLTATGRLMRMNVVFVLGIVLNVVLNMILINAHGAWGAGLATVVTQYFVLVAEVWLVSRLLPVKLGYTFGWRAWSFLAVMAGMAFSLREFCPGAWWWGFGGSILVGGGLALWFRLVRLQELRGWLRRDG